MKRGASKKTGDGAKRAKTTPVESLPTPGSDDGNVPRLAGPGNVVLPPSAFQFCVISKGRPANVPRMHALFEGTGVRPTWIVGAGETAAYRAAGASDVRVGGGLCESRNMAIDIASAADKGKGRLCVQLSDDLSTVHFCESRKECSMSLAEWRRPNQEDANRLAREATEHALTPVGGAQLLEVGMRAPKLRLAGGYCTANRGFALRQPMWTFEHFIVGDFMVIDCRQSKTKGVGTAAGGEGDGGAATGEKEDCAGVSVGPQVVGPELPYRPTQWWRAVGDSPVTPGPLPRFDEGMKLKEDYDLTCQHIATYGGAARSNRIFVKAQHYTNEGGAVAVRNHALEQKTIKHLRRKWPGVFQDQRRKNEVIMKWLYRKPFLHEDVVKEFDGQKYKGWVDNFYASGASWNSAEQAGDMDLWHIRYEDGDAEDLGLAELAAVLVPPEEGAAVGS